MCFPLVVVVVIVRVVPVRSSFKQILRSVSVFHFLGELPALFI